MPAWMFRLKVCTQLLALHSVFSYFCPGILDSIQNEGDVPNGKHSKFWSLTAASKKPQSKVTAIVDRVAKKQDARDHALPAPVAVPASGAEPGAPAEVFFVHGVFDPTFVRGVFDPTFGIKGPNDVSLMISSSEAPTLIDFLSLPSSTRLGNLRGMSIVELNSRLPPLISAFTISPFASFNPEFCIQLSEESIQITLGEIAKQMWSLSDEAKHDVWPNEDSTFPALLHLRFDPSALKKTVNVTHGPVTESAAVDGSTLLSEVLSRMNAWTSAAASSQQQAKLKVTGGSMPLKIWLPQPLDTICTRLHLTEIIITIP
jgi:hypothetical protein